MKMIGDFVSLSPDQRRGDLVDGLIELFHGDPCKALGEKDLQAGVDGFPPDQASADVVFPETGMGFVDTERGEFSKGKTIGFGRQTLFVKGMTGLVDTTPGHVRKVTLIYPGSDADILGI